MNKIYSENHNHKRILTNTIFLYVRMVLVMFISLYTSRIILKALGVIDYGVYNVVGGIATVFSFISTALTVSSQRFLSYELGKENTKIKTVYGTILMAYVILSCIAFIVSELFGIPVLTYILKIPNDRIYAAHWVLQSSILMFILSIIQSPFNAVLMAFEKMKGYAYISILEVFLKLFVAFSLINTTFDKLIFYSVLMFICKLFIVLYFFIHTEKNVKDCSIKDIKYYSISKLKEVSSFTSWNFLGSMSLVGMNQGTNILLNIFFGPTINTARGIAIQITNTLLNVSSNFQNALNPVIVKSYSNKDFKYFNTLLISGSKLSFFLLYIISIPILFYTKDILDLWLGATPQETIFFTQLAIIIAMIDCISFYIATAIQATGKIKLYQCIISVIILLNIPISYISLKLNASSYSVYYISLVLSITSLIARLILTQKTIPTFSCTFFLKKLLQHIIFPCIITCIFLVYINNYTKNLFLFIPYSITVNILVIYTLGLSENEKNKIKKIWK